MDAEKTTRQRGHTARLAAVFAAAALAIPGGMLVSNALAADGSTSATDSTVVPIQQDETPARDRRDCPEEEGGAAPSGGSSTQETAL